MFPRRLRVGGGLMVMRRRARSGGSRINGGSPSAISMAVMPSDQMSTWWARERERDGGERRGTEGYTAKGRV